MIRLAITSFEPCGVARRVGIPGCQGAQASLFDVVDVKAHIGIVKDRKEKQMPDLVRIPLPIDPQESSVDLDLWREVIRSMDRDKRARLIAVGLPALKAMIKVFDEENISMMQQSGDTQMAVLDNEGNPTGQIIKLKTARKYDTDKDRLKLAQDMFHKAGRKDVKLVWDQPKALMVTSIMKIVHGIGKDDSKELQEAAHEAEMSVEEVSKRYTLKIDKGKNPAARSRIADVRQEINQEEENPFK